MTFDLGEFPSKVHWLLFQLIILKMAVLPTELAFELSGHQGAVRAVRFNSELLYMSGLQNKAHLFAENGNYCLTCGSDKTLRLWNPHKGLCIKTYMGHGAEVLDADA